MQPCPLGPRPTAPLQAPPGAPSPPPAVSFAGTDASPRPSEPPGSPDPRRGDQLASGPSQDPTHRPHHSTPPPTPSSVLQPPKPQSVEGQSLFTCPALFLLPLWAWLAPRRHPTGSSPAEGCGGSPEPPNRGPLPRPPHPPALLSCPQTALQGPSFPPPLGLKCSLFFKACPAAGLPVSSQAPAAPHLLPASGPSRGSHVPCQSPGQTPRVHRMSPLARSQHPERLGDGQDVMQQVLGPGGWVERGLCWPTRCPSPWKFKPPSCPRFLGLGEAASGSPAGIGARPRTPCTPTNTHTHTRLSQAWMGALQHALAFLASQVGKNPVRPGQHPDVSLRSSSHKGAEQRRPAQPADL